MHFFREPKNNLPIYFQKPISKTMILLLILNNIDSLNQFRDYLANQPTVLGTLYRHFNHHQDLQSTRELNIPKSLFIDES